MVTNTLSSNISTIGSLYSNYGTIASLYSINLSVSGNTTFANSLINNNTIGNLLVTGNATLGNSYVSNITVGSINVSSGILTNSITSSSLLNTGNATLNNVSINNITSASLTVSNSINSATITVSGGITCGSNIKSGAGTLGPFIMLQTSFIDTSAGNYTGFTSSNTVIFTENGNPGLNGCIGYTNGFGTGSLSDGSNDNISWNNARLVIRGVSLNTGNSNTNIVLQPIVIQCTSGNVYTQGTFTVTDNGSNRGYSTWVSPWFNTNIVSDAQAIGIKVLSINGVSTGNVRIGTSYLQFRS